MPSHRYMKPGRTKSTMARLSAPPMPRKKPSWDIIWCLETKPRPRPTTIIALPEVETETVTALTVRITASRFGSARRNSR